MTHQYGSERVHDLTGVGFGPSNLALAIALRERAQRTGAALDAVFLEKQLDFAWHGNMLLDDSRMQVSFLKDLVTLRDPSSRLSFINYLHEQGRLEDFINLKTFFPTRVEYNQYLRWAALQFSDECLYGEEVVRIEPRVEHGAVSQLRVISRNPHGLERSWLTRNLVVGTGGAPHIPDVFSATRDPRIFHSADYLQQAAKLNGPRRIAVVGAGQSAAEIFLDLTRLPDMQVDLIIRGQALKPADNSPLVNEVFNASFTDLIFHQPAEVRSRMIADFSDTNYAVADLELIEKIYELLYLQKVTGASHHTLLRNRTVTRVVTDTDGIQLSLHDALAARHEARRYDAVVLATGYERSAHRELLRNVREYLGDFEVDRSYRVQHRKDFLPGVYLQGCCESTHGLSDTLLSVLAIRSREIAESLWLALPAQRQPAHRSGGLAAERPLSRSA